MDPILLKNYLLEELKNYNYVLGSRLLTIHLNNLKKIYLEDLQSVELLNDFIHFLIANKDELENVSNGFQILCNINNIFIIVDLLCFFNPTSYYHLRKEL
jgi:hypothetical protein